MALKSMETLNIVEKYQTTLERGNKHQNMQICTATKPLSVVNEMERIPWISDYYWGCWNWPRSPQSPSLIGKCSVMLRCARQFEMVA